MKESHTIITTSSSRNENLKRKSYSVKLNYKDYCFLGVFFLFSLIISNLYISGDQEFYHMYYSNVRSLDLIDGYALYIATLGSLEPGYFLFSFLFSRIIDKNVLFSIVNVYISYKVLIFFKENDVSLFNRFIIFLNFYLLALFFSIDRLKLSLLLLILSFTENRSKSISFTILSFLTHVQIILLIAAKMIFNDLSFFGKMIIKLYVPKKKVGVFLLGILLLFSIGYLSDHIISKILFYNNISDGFTSILKPVFFMLLSYIHFKDRNLTMIQLPMVLASFFVGEERLVIFSFLTYIFFAVKRKKLNSPINQLLLFYFFLKGIIYLFSIIQYGDGYANLFI